MLTPELTQTLAFVLSRRPWREHDLQLHCLTQQFGYQLVVAFGAASPRSTRGRLCQPYDLLQLEILHKRSAQSPQLILQDAFLHRSAKLNVVADELRLGSANYINQWLRKLHHYLELDAAMMHAFSDCFIAVADSASRLDLLLQLRQFELLLLKCIGFDVLALLPQSFFSNTSVNCYFDVSDGWQLSQQPLVYSLDAQQLHTFYQLGQLPIRVINTPQWQADLLQIKRHNQHLLKRLLH